MPLTVVLGAIPAPRLVQWPESDPLPKALPVVCTVDEPPTFWFASIKRSVGGGGEGDGGGGEGDGGDGEGGGGEGDGGGGDAQHARLQQPAPPFVLQLCTAQPAPGQVAGHELVCHCQLTRQKLPSESHELSK